MPKVNDLSDEARALIAGLVHETADTCPSDELCAAVGVWQELRNEFMVAEFHDGLERGALTQEFR